MPANLRDRSALGAGTRSKTKD